MRLSSLAAACLLAGCTNSGSLDLDLSLPTTPDLRPTGATTITVLASSPQMDPIANTSVITDDKFAAGDLPVGKNVEIDVLLHDVSNRLVGIGQAPHRIDISGDHSTSLTVPVRRPFIYASSGSTLYSFDPTLDPRDVKFQGQLSGLTSPQLAVSVGGDRLVVASSNELQVIDTATHKVTGPAIPIPGTIHDAAPVPGTHEVAVAHSAGITIVDLDTMAVASAATPSVDRVTVGSTVDGTIVAYGLIGRVAPPAGPVDACTGTSSLVQVDVDAPSDAKPVALPQAVSDLAAPPDAPGLFATLPCAGKVVRVDGTMLSDVSMLERAAVLTVAGGRIWAAGARAATPVCADSNGKTPCTTGAAASCPAQPAPVTMDYVTDGAHLIVESIPLAGGDPIQLDVPERRETMVSTDDEAGEHAQVLHSYAVTPLDLVALPGGQYVALVTASRYFTSALVTTQFGTQEIILPCLDASTGDWLLLDMASSSIAQRVRTQCDLTVGPSDSIFQGFACADPPPGERAQLGTYQPISVGALFGAR